MKTVKISLALLLLVFSQIHAAQKPPCRYLNDASVYNLALLRARALDDTTKNDTTRVVYSVKGYKSRIGILFSAVVPGSGEMYAGSWIKGALFLGLEVGMWTMYAHYHGQGDDIEDTFHEYADTHWSKDKWLYYYNDESDPATHSLPDKKTQQYYEMIGKYDQFKQGWDDWSPGSPDLTEHRDHYETLRNDSNVAYKNASYCTMVVLLNHLASAFDTAWTIRKYNREVKSRVRVGVRPGQYEMQPFVVLNLTF